MGEIYKYDLTNGCGVGDLKTKGTQPSIDLQDHGKYRIPGVPHVHVYMVEDICCLTSYTLFLLGPKNSDHYVNLGYFCDFPYTLLIVELA